MNYAHYVRYGRHRCNLCTDIQMGSGAYCYTSAESVINAIDLKTAPDRRIVVGVIRGYLHKSETAKARMSLDPRSCKLLGFRSIRCASGTTLSIWRRRQIIIKVGPLELGAPVYWCNQIWNMSPGDDAKVRITVMINGDIRSLNKEYRNGQRKLYI